MQSVYKLFDLAWSVKSSLGVCDILITPSSLISPKTLKNGYSVIEKSSRRFILAPMRK